MQVKIHELFDHTDTNGDNIKVVTIGNMQGVVVTIQPKGSDGGVSVALDYSTIADLTAVLKSQSESHAWRLIQAAQKELEQ